MAILVLLSLLVLLVWVTQGPTPGQAMPFALLIVVGGVVTMAAALAKAVAKSRKRKKCYVCGRKETGDWRDWWGVQTTCYHVPDGVFVEHCRSCHDSDTLEFCRRTGTEPTYIDVD